MIQLALAARKGRGKDTFVKIAQKIDPDIERIGFADAVKEELEDFAVTWLLKTSSPDTWSERIRDATADRSLMGPGWQWWGQLRREVNGENYWLNELHNRIRDRGLWNKPFIIADLRHYNEVEWCRFLGIRTVRIVGPDRRIHDGRSDMHESEVYVDELRTNYVIHNESDLETFELNVRDLLAVEFGVGVAIN